MKKIILVVGLVILANLSFAYMKNCTCTSYQWSPTGWYEVKWNFASNSSCTPNSPFDYTNFYSFGYAELYFEGQYLGTTYYTLQNNLDIREDIDCFNFV